MINQIGWDTRKDDELLRWIRRDGARVSAVANVYLLSRGAARVFHAGQIPGVVVTDELLELAEQHGASPDKGRAFFVDLAAKHLAVARGLGFSGVYLGGHMPAATFGEILDRADAFAAEDWRELAREMRFPLPDEFYFFEPTRRRGSRPTSSTPRISSRSARADRPARADHVPLQPAHARSGVRRRRAAASPPGGPSTAPWNGRPRPIGKARTRSSRRRRCRCSAARTAATARCPRSPTSARSRSARRTSATAPAAARATALCEVYDTECIWSQAYERLKAYGEEESMLDGPVVVKDNALAGHERVGEHVPRPRPPRAGGRRGGRGDGERFRIDLANHLAETD